MFVYLFQAAYLVSNPVIAIILALCNLMYFVDIYLKCHISFYNINGDLIDDYHEVRTKYLKDFNGFAVDMVAALPMDICGYAVTSIGPTLIVYLRLLQLVRLVRIHQFFQNWQKELHVNMMVVRCFQFILYLFLMIHFIACMWYTLACPLSECMDGSWYSVEAAKGITVVIYLLECAVNLILQSE